MGDPGADRERDVVRASPSSARPARQLSQLPHGGSNGSPKYDEHERPPAAVGLRVGAHHVHARAVEAAALLLGLGGGPIAADGGRSSSAAATSPLGSTSTAPASSSRETAVVSLVCEQVGRLLQLRGLDRPGVLAHGRQHLARSRRPRRARRRRRSAAARGPRCGRRARPRPARRRGPRGRPPGSRRRATPRPRCGSTQRTSALSIPMPNAVVAHDDVEVAVHEALLDLVALGALHARVVGGRAQAALAQRLGELLGLRGAWRRRRSRAAWRPAIRSASARSLRSSPASPWKRSTARRMFGPVEAADDDRRVAQAEPLDDLVAHRRRGGRGQREDRRAPERLARRRRAAGSRGGSRGPTRRCSAPRRPPAATARRPRARRARPGWRAARARGRGTRATSSASSASARSRSAARDRASSAAPRRPWRAPRGPRPGRAGARSAARRRRSRPGISSPAIW